MTPERRAELIKQFEVQGNPIEREMEDRLFHLVHFHLAGIARSDDIRLVLLQAYANGQISFERWLELDKLLDSHSTYAKLIWDDKLDEMEHSDRIEWAIESMPKDGCSEYAEEIFLFLLWDDNMLPEQQTEALSTS